MAAILGSVRRGVAIASCIASLMAAGCGSTEVHRIAEWRHGAAVHPAAGAWARGAAGQAASTSGTASRAASQKAAEARSGSGRGAPTDAEVRRELEQAFGSRAGRAIDAAALGSGGLATVPPAAPSRVAAIINAANSVARKPYVYGGGHGRLADETFVDTAYDCSGSVSFALAAAGLVDSPMDSSALARFGRPGPRAVGDDLRQRRPRVHDRGRAALRHLGARRRRLALAGGLAHGGGFTVRHPAGL